MPPLHVAIVGGGAAGSLLALRLHDRMPGRCRITMLDRDGRFGRGVAYSATAPWHRLNVPAAKMGGRTDDDPDGFVAWLARRVAPAPASYADTFVPRRLYGDYLRGLLDALVADGTLVMRQAAVVAVEPHGDGHRIRTTDEGVEADVVVLCLGNPAPSPIAGIVAGERWIGDVWKPDALAPVAADDDVLLVGTGATAIDVVLDLTRRGVARRITAVSRRGLLPYTDVPPAEYAGYPELADGRITVAGLMRDLRREIALAQRSGVPWQAVLDSFRRHILPIWQRFDEAERRRFLRHVRSPWLVHRHRLAPDIAETLERLRAEGRLSIVAGRLSDVSPHPHGYRGTIARRDGRREDFAVDWIINCSGPEERYDRLDDPLVRQLFASGHARPGPLGLGLDVDHWGRLFARDGRMQNNLYALGPPTRGSFWEVTAAPWIRANAARIVEHIRTIAGPINQRCNTAAADRQPLE